MYLLTIAMCDISCVLNTCYLLKIAMCDTIMLVIHRCYLLKIAMCDISCLLYWSEDSNVWYRGSLLKTAICDIRCLLYTKCSLLKIASTEDSNVWCLYADAIYWSEDGNVWIVWNQLLVIQMLSTEDSNVWYQLLVIRRCYLLKIAMCDIIIMLVNAIYWR